MENEKIAEIFKKIDECDCLLKDDDINYMLNYFDELEHYAKELEKEVEELKREREELILEIDPYKRYALNESDFH